MLRYFTHWTTSRNGHSPLRESLRKTLSPRQSLSILWIPLIPSVWIRAISYRVKDYRKNYLGYTRRISALASPRPYMFRSYRFVSTLSLETCCYIPFNPSFIFLFPLRKQSTMTESEADQVYRTNPVLKYSKIPLKAPLLPLPYGQSQSSREWMLYLLHKESFRNTFVLF